MKRLLLLFILGATIAQATETIEIVITGNGTTGPYALCQKQIVPASEKVQYRDSLLVDGMDYRIDLREKIIFFSRSLPIGDSVLVRLEVWPLMLSDSYYLMRPEEIDRPETTTFAGRPQPVINKTGGIELAGSKNFAVNFGNSGEPSLTQSLDLIISGNLGGNVRLSGNISDRNLGAGGQTEAVDELDRVSVNLTSPTFAADFGNLELSGVDGSILDFRRRLIGLKLSGFGGPVSGTGAVAFSPGAQKEIRFFGVDGRQGPYPLTGGELAANTGTGQRTIVRGTEEVFIDGRKLSRGIDNDYEIDYDYGYITFTPKVIITSQNLISVKFQVPLENYRRSFYRSDIAFERGPTISFQFIGENDDESRPRAFELGDAEKRAIETAGADPESAFIGGASYVGQNQGNYEAIVDSSLDTIYVYAGVDSGSYDVYFSLVGTGKGDYEYAGFGRYVYVGKGLGSYLARKYFPLPNSANYGSVMLKSEGDLHFRSELAVSRYDLNKLSSADNIRTGLGISLSGGWKKDSLPGLGRVWDFNILEIKDRRFDNYFIVPGAIDTIELFRQYNLPLTSTGRYRRQSEFMTSAVSNSGEYIRVGAGELKADGISASNRFGHVSFRALQGLNLFGAVDLSESRQSGATNKSQWDRFETGTRFSGRRIASSLVGRYDIKKGQDRSTEGIRVVEIESSADLRITGRLSSSGKYILRRRRFAPSVFTSNQWVYQSRADQYEAAVKLDGGGKGVSGELGLVYIDNRAFYPNIERSTRYAGNSKIELTYPGIAFSFYENLNGSTRSAKVREFVYVGRGKGDYRLDGQDYVPEQGGEYIQVIRPAGQLRDYGPAGYEISGGWRSRFEGDALPVSSFAKKITIENDLAFENDLAPEVDLQIGHLFPIFGGYSRPRYESFDMRNRTTFRLPSPFEYIRNTLNLSRNRGARYDFESVDDRLSAVDIELRFDPQKTMGYLFAAGYAADKRVIYSGAYDIHRYKVELTQFYKLSKTFRLEIPVSVRREREIRRDFGVSSFGGGLKMVLSLGAMSRFESQLNYLRVNAQTRSRIAYLFADGRKDGDNFDGLLLFRFRLNSYTEMEIRYSYKRLGDGYDNYNLRLQAKAEF